MSKLITYIGQLGVFGHTNFRIYDKSSFLLMPKHTVEISYFLVWLNTNLESVKEIAIADRDKIFRIANNATI